MMLTDAIRESSTEHEIYFLLTSYIEAVCYCDESRRLPHEMRNLPIAGLDDLRARIGKLKTVFGASPEKLAKMDHAIAKEALDIFCCAQTRLSYLVSARAMVEQAA